jgi:AcrR family transcriptional regulator
MALAESEDVEALGALVAEHPRGRVPRELRRRHILSIATELFVSRGFLNTSMDELARRAGVSKPVIYDLVGSKEALFHEIVAVETSRLTLLIEGAVQSEPDSAQKLRAGLRAFFGFVAARRAVWRLLTSSSDGPIAGEFAAARAVQARAVAKLLASSAAEFDAEVSPLVLDAVAHAVNGAAEALGVWWNDHPEATADALADIVAQLVLPGLLSFAQAQ